VRLIENQTIKNRIFLASTTTFTGVFLANDWYDWADECLVQYIFTGLLCKITAGLFVWWWVQVGKASSVYRWVIALMCALAVTYDAMAYSRWLWASGDVVGYECAISSWWWRYRGIMVTITLLYMASLAIARICCASSDDPDVPTN
jgi:hypothetical protein